MARFEITAPLFISEPVAGRVITLAKGSVPFSRLGFKTSSLENFGKFTYVDKIDNAEVRHVRICPMYAIAQMEDVKQGIEK